MGPLTAAKTQSLYQSKRRAFATLISPCAAKGAGVVAAMARRLPQIPFLCVATRWTRDAEPEVAALRRLPNVVVAPGAPSERMDERVWSRTRVLLAPSLWPEPFGLVAVEASLRGIPALCTATAGLREADVAKMALPCDVMMDIHCQKTFARESGAGDVAAAFAALSDEDRDALRRGGNAPPFRAAVAADAERTAAPFAETLRPLFDDAANLRAAAAASRAAAEAHVGDRRHALAALLRGLDPGWPCWVRPPPGAA